MSAQIAFARQELLFRVQRYGTEDGLPSNGIKGLQWDKQTGFLWIATEAGMVRFNGMSFKTYTHEDNPQITNERILFLVRNNAGTIYTADNAGNIFSVKKNSLSFLKKKIVSGDAWSNISTIAVSDFLYNTNHVFTNGPFSLQFSRVLPLSDTACYILNAGSLYYFSVSMQSPVPFALPVKNIAAAFKAEGAVFVLDQQNNAWLINSSTGQLTAVGFLFDGQKQRFHTSNNLFIWENGMQYPVLITGEKAWKISFSKGTLNAALICNRVPQDALIRFVQYDEAINTLFIGTDSKGIIVIRQNKVMPVRKERISPKERTSYYSQVELPDGNIMTNEGHLLGRNNPGNAVPPFSGIFSTGTYMAGDSVFWCIRQNAMTGPPCLHSYDFKTKRITAYPKIFQSSTQLVMTKSGDRLYLVNESGLFRMQGDSLLSVYSYTRPDRARIHFDMKETEPGVLTIANCNAILRYTIRSGKMDTLYSLGNYCVRTIWQYKEYTFFGTYGNGLYASKNGKVKALPPDKNLYLRFTHCFIEDGSGYCWISTNRGLFKASIAEMINAYETGTPQVYYHYYGSNDGMDMTEMNGGCTPCGLVMKNKTISFPTMEGLLWVKPANAIPVLPEGEIYIDELLVNNKRTGPATLETKPLPAARHDIQIQLGFSAWCNKENIYLQYQLNEEEWKTVNTDNGALLQFSNLKSGDYMLRVRKLNGFGVNNYSYREIRFAIAAYWYQRWWFYLLCAVTAWGLVALYFRYRTRQFKIRQRKLERQVAEKTKELQEQNEVLEKNNSIKTRLISIISHDIITPLKFLTVAGKKLIEKRKEMPEQLQQETIEEMANTSQELQLLSTNILNWIKYQNENRRLVKETFGLHEMVTRVLGLLQSLAKQKNLVIENVIDPSLTLRQFYEPVKILLYNLLTNAINFSEKGIITVAASQGNGSITISVKDRGTGMTAEQVEKLLAEEMIITSSNADNKRGHGLGYLIIKDLIKTMGASLSIESRKDEGTTVSVNLPSVKKAAG